MSHFFRLRASLWRSALVFLVSLSLFAVSYPGTATPAHATPVSTIVVTSGGEPAGLNGSAANCTPTAGGYSCPTLRDAMAAAVDNTTISFDPAVSTVALSDTLPIVHNVTIDGTAPNAPVITAALTSTTYPLLTVPATVTTVLSGTTITHNLNGAFAFNGSGIINSGTLTVTNATLSNNGSEYGGGVANAGTLSISNTSVYSNFAAFGGGAFNIGSMNISNTSLYSNAAEVAGGGIANAGVLTGTTLLLRHNLSTAGGGIASLGNDVFFSAISQPIHTTITQPLTVNTTLVSSTLSNNLAIYAGGGLLNVGNFSGPNVALTTAYLTDTTVYSNGVVVGGGVVPGIVSAAGLSPDSLPYLGSLYGGGGIANLGAILVLADSTISSNAVGVGFNFGIGAVAQPLLSMAHRFGALQVPGSGALRLPDLRNLPPLPLFNGPGGAPPSSSHLGTTVSTSGCGQFVGGAGVLNVFALADVFGTTVYSNGFPLLGTLQPNITPNCGVVQGPAQVPVGILSGGGFENLDGELALINSTVYSNQAVLGSAVETSYGASVISNTTVYANSGINQIQGYSQTTQLQNSIVSGNPLGTACSQALTDNGGNLADDPSCSFTNAQSLQSVPGSLLPFGPLMNNGGPTPTLRPLPGSRALDFGLGSACQTVVPTDMLQSLLGLPFNLPLFLAVNGVDQRNYPRPAPPAPYCDSGAYQATVALMLTPSVPNGVLNTPYLTTPITASPTLTTTVVVTPTYTFMVSHGALPPGLSLDPTTGLLSGTPTQSGVFTFTVTASAPALDGNLTITVEGSQSYTITVLSSCSVNGLISVPREGYVLFSHVLSPGTAPITARVLGLYGGPGGSGVVTLNQPQARACAALQGGGTTATVTGSAGGTGSLYPLGDQLAAQISIGAQTTVVLSDLSQPQLPSRTYSTATVGAKSTIGIVAQP